MSNSIQCPACKQNIDGDSLYCDQCGLQILVCSDCGRPGKGKRCMFDGKELVVPGGTVPSSSATEQISKPASAPQAASPAAPQAASPAPPQTPPPSGDKLRLFSQGLGLTIEASQGDILGRTKGSFTGILGRFSHISGGHCQVLKTNGVWCIMDCGSTNGTFYNGAKLNANVPVPVQNNGRVKLADIEFLVSFDQGDSGTARI